MRALPAILIPLLAAGCLDGVVGDHQVEALDFVRSSSYRKMVIEVDSAQGKAPSGSLTAFMHDRLAAVLDKPDGIEVRVDEAGLADTDRSWSTNDLLDYGRSHLGARTQGSTAVLHVLFLAGHAAADNGDNKVLGVTIGNGLVAIFSDSVASLCDGALLPGTCSTAPFFQSVVLHELGHAIGLVDNGVPMQRNHEAATCNSRPDSHHSSNRNSVMFCAAEQSALFGNLFGNNPPSDFDADDKADLKAAQR